jgi:alcohol dehydrogenase
LAIYDLHLLQRIFVGPDAIDKVVELAQVSPKRALVVTDRGVKSAGYLNRVLASLQASSFDSFVLDSVPENPTAADIEKGVQFARESLPLGVIIGLGGGSPMDCAKAINIVLSYGGDLKLYLGYNDFHTPLMPSIGIPTTAGTGSEAQSYAVIADPDTHHKRAYGGRGVRFGAVVLDPKLCLSMPARLTALCGIDAISHVFESYVSTRRSPVSQMFAREAWRRIYSAFERVFENPADLEARAEMLWGAHFAGAAIENSMLGAAHATANPITARYDVTHGLAVGLMLPHVIKMNISVCGDLYDELVQTGGMDTDTEPVDLLCQWMRQIFSRAGLPLSLAECGVERRSLRAMAREAATQWTGRFNPKPVGEADLLELYEGAYS